MPYRVPVIVFAALLLSACTSSSERLTVADNAPQFVVAVPSDPWQPPEPIDLAYLQRVIDRLEEVRASIRRDIVATSQFTENDQRRLNAMFGAPALPFQSAIWQDAATNHSDLKTNAGSNTYVVQQIMIATDSCVWFKAQPDDRANTFSQTTQLRGDYVIKRQAHDKSINPTPWVLTQFVPESLGVVSEANACV